MNAPDFNAERLEELLLSSVCQSFPEADRAELNAMLRHSSEARFIAARSLTFDANLAESLAAGEAFHQHEISSRNGDPKSVNFDFKASHWFAKAAAWVGAFHSLGNTAKAAGSASGAAANTVSTSSTIVILMKKTIISITTAILVFGSSGIYAIHHHNQSSRARVATMETEIQSLSDELGIKTTRIASRQTGITHSANTVSLTQVLAIFEGRDGLSPEEVAILDRFEKQLGEMDAESLKDLLLDAEKVSNPIDGTVAGMIMDALILKSPADGTQIATQLIGRSFEFPFHLSHKAAEAFKAWLAKDPAAADAWYVATAAAGGLRGKSIAPNGIEYLAIDRSFARLRLAAQVEANPPEASAMMGTMLPEDVTTALQTITDPNALGKILPALRPEQKSSMAVGVIKAMAVKDIHSAFAWANSLGMADRDRDTLMANGIEAAVASGKLDLQGVAELNPNLNLDAERRSEMLVSAAKSVSLIPRKNEHVIEVDNSVHWDRVAERIDWLRKEAPADYSAGKMVGDYLGGLLFESYNFKKSIEAYENEVSRLGKVDPDLTIEFASKLYFLQKDGSENKARELLKTLPPSEKRDAALDKFGAN